MKLSLQGKRAMVCGSSQGIGWASAKLLAEMGAEVCLVARSENKLKQNIDLLDNSSAQVHHYLVADFSSPQGLKTALESHLSKEEPYHILVNNTGGPPAGPAHSADLEEYLNAFNQHLACNHILVQALLPGMKGFGEGRIVNVISTSVKMPLKGLGVSNTIRGAVANWSKTLANELGAFNITVNNVLPGATETGRLTSIIENKAKKMGVSKEDAAASMLAEVPLKRFAQPKEVASAVAFLCSDEAAYISGINIPVDGGRTGCL